MFVTLVYFRGAASAKAPTAAFVIISTTWLQGDVAHSLLMLICSFKISQDRREKPHVSSIYVGKGTKNDAK